MDSEIIAVGSELLTPSRLDTNSLYLTGQLNALGVEVVAKTIVGDDRERLAATVSAAVSRSALVILTGGLGPTEDDVTRDAVALALERPQVFRQELCDAIEARFRRMGRQMAEINRRQAFLIEGAAALPNENGTAAGQWIELNGKVVILLPGPPPELIPMFVRECLPRLERMLPGLVIRTRLLRVAGMPESDVDQRISPVYTKYRNPATTILAAPGDIQIHLRARCETAEEAEKLLDEVASRIEAILGDRIYSNTGAPLEEVIGDMLRRRSETLAVAESCTGGRLAERITSVPGSSDYFAGGFLVYADRMKAALLGIEEDFLARYGSVSREVAEAMASHARQRTGAAYAVSVTGVAGPGGGAEATPVGTVFIGIAAPGGSRVHAYRFLGDRDRIRMLAAHSALDLLRRVLVVPTTDASSVGRLP
jgi:nicotinamide-nucleotide amidase